mgnify:CR=1 FL=1
MKIDEQGIELESISDVLNSEETNLQSVYGADFYIKPEGVIDNIFTSAAFQELDLQEQIAFLCKQNPNAEISISGAVKLYEYPEGNMRRVICFIKETSFSRPR